MNLGDFKLVYVIMISMQNSAKMIIYMHIIYTYLCCIILVFVLIHLFVTSRYDFKLHQGQPLFKLVVDGSMVDAKDFKQTRNTSCRR